ncbi:MAG: MarR family winged helix-turn-helix transcriptional regulator [Bacteroidota bacterium]|nr:MarR family winged helix-turn-helix transcriptional regulator [Bacteroidota bacterium]
MSEKREGGYLISQIHQVTGRVFSKKLKDYQIDINHAQGRIIFALWKNDNVPINDLAKETSLSKSTLTAMLERLELSGHIIRKPSETDKRITLVCLTTKSSALREDYQRLSEDMLDQFYNGFTDEEITLFEMFLERILANMKQH